MPASDAQIIANRMNAARSTGPTTAAGKDRSRRNALKHGLAATVVVPGEEEGEVAFRVALLQESLAEDDDGLALILAERAGYLSMRLKRCFQHDSAMAAGRVRAAEAEYDDDRRTAAEHVLSYIANEPATGARQLRATPEGVDLLIALLTRLRGEVDSRWEEWHCYQFDQAIGVRSGVPPCSRVRALTNLATKGDASALPTGAVDAIPAGDRAAWALAEIAVEVDAELTRLRAHRATLDLARFAADRAQAGERAKQRVDKDTALARKYEASAERAFDRALDQIRAYRRERRLTTAAERAAARAATDHDHGDEAIERRDGAAALLANLAAVAQLGAPADPDPVAPPAAIAAEPATTIDPEPRPASDRPIHSTRRPRGTHRPADPAAIARLGSFVPGSGRGAGPVDASKITIGKPPATPATDPKSPRYTP